MNDWQVSQQIKYLLANREWTASVPVFGEVKITQQPAEEVVDDLTWPFALVSIGPWRADPEHGEEANYLRQVFVVSIGTAVAGDPWGEAVLIGANRVAQLDSRGKGILEVAEQVSIALEELHSGTGIETMAMRGSGIATKASEDRGDTAFRSFEYHAWLTGTRFYHPAEAFAGNVSGSDVVMTWALPADRFDRLKMILRRASGSTPPATATTGDDVALSGDLATSKTDTPGSGTWSYSLFVAYDETSLTPTTADRHSAARTLSGLVVA